MSCVVPNGSIRTCADGERADHVVVAPQVLVPRRHPHAGTPEDVPTATLGTKVREGGIASVQRDAKANRQRALARRRREAGEMRRRRIIYERANPGKKRGTVEDLVGERGRRRISAREHRQARPRVRAFHSVHEPEVILNDGRRDRLAREIDDARRREPEEHEQAEESLLVVRCSSKLRQFLTVERHAGDDHDGARRSWVGEHAAKHGREPALQPLERV